MVDYINRKRTIEVGIIPLDVDTMKNLQTALEMFNVTVSFLNPDTGALTTIDCIIPSNGIEYYTIQDNKVMYKAFTLTFTEL